MSADIFPEGWAMVQSPDDPNRWRGGWGMGNGYDFMQDALPRPWRPVASWGADGWDLGDWPLVCVAHQCPRRRAPGGCAVRRGRPIRPSVRRPCRA